MSGHWSDRSDHVSKHGDFHGNVSHESVPIGCHDIRVTTPNCERRFHCAASRHPLHLLACVRRRFPDVELRAEKRGHVHSGGKGVGESEYGQVSLRAGRVSFGQGDDMHVTRGTCIRVYETQTHLLTHRTRGPGRPTTPKIFPVDAKTSPSPANLPRVRRLVVVVWRWWTLACRISSSSWARLNKNSQSKRWSCSARRTNWRRSRQPWSSEMSICFLNPWLLRLLVYSSFVYGTWSKVSLT